MEVPCNSLIEASLSFCITFRQTGRDSVKNVLKKDFDINYLTDAEQRKYPTDQDVYQRTQTDYIMFLQQQHVDDILALANVVKIWPVIASRPGTPRYYQTCRASRDRSRTGKKFCFLIRILSHGERPYNDTWDNFGPILIPAAGQTVELTAKNLTVSEES